MIIPVIMGILIIGAFLTLIGNMIADLVLLKLNPNYEEKIDFTYKERKILQILKTIEELQEVRKKYNWNCWICSNNGCFTQWSHISFWLKQARDENDIVIVSIFVNPTQFLPGEDLDAYPRKDEADKRICEMCKVDYLFMPEISTMYSKEEVLIKAPNKSYIFRRKNKTWTFWWSFKSCFKTI